MWGIAVNASNHTKCVSLPNDKRKTQPTIINLHPKKYRQELHYYPFAVNLDRCFESYNTINDSCIPNKIENSNLGVFSIITGVNESKILTKHIPECKCKFDGRKCNSYQKWVTINFDVSAKNITHVKKKYLGSCHM